ncbi:DUF5693 family protein [Paenibacillus sp. SC116]|uniref:DUF5693 family protein n=1 Tax=Paenibacillus sp. SC116 TaxID=2968986 RepID=UPI00215B6330|nr:DUF5693 family protein [Paenibacillus sp. SC116]MCR8842160.1 DUF5693 family protein [Paenibacillus sp. SC116]
MNLSRNDRLTRWIWCFVIIGMLASIPLAYQRVATENTSRNVQFVMHYRDLLQMSDSELHPTSFIQEQLNNMKEAGINAIAIHESTLQELNLSRRIDMYSSREVSVLTSQPISPQENFTYILFTDPYTRAYTMMFIEQQAQRLNIKTHPWTFNEQDGLILEMPIKDATIMPLDYDPTTLQILKHQQFEVIAYISNRRPFDANALDKSLAMLRNYGVTTLVIDGEAVPGVSKSIKEQDNNIKLTAELMLKHGLKLALPELQKTEPIGLQSLASKLDNQIIRTHIFSDFDSGKLMGTLNDKQLEALKTRFTDRLVLAVKDRNIRTILISAKPAVSASTGTYDNPLEPLYSILNGEESVTARLEKFSIQVGQAPVFEAKEVPMQLLWKWLMIGVGIAIIALLVGCFYPALLLPSLVLGVVASAGLYILSPLWLYKIIALGACTAAPTVALILAIRTLRKKQSFSLSPAQRIVTGVTLFIRTSIISLIGGMVIFSLLNDIVFLLKVDQFQGVGLASIIPIGFVALYVIFFDKNELSLREKAQFVKRILLTPITILWCVIAAACSVFLLYYFIRTGNSGVVSPIELLFRALLEQTLGVRPRLKEFLFAYPLFFLGAYLALSRVKAGIIIFAISIIGQISLVNTFAHLHTPLIISFIRVGLGMALGIMMGLLAIAAWHIVCLIWNYGKKRWSTLTN